MPSARFSKHSLRMRLQPKLAPAWTMPPIGRCLSVLRSPMRGWQANASSQSASCIVLHTRSAVSLNCGNARQGAGSDHRLGPLRARRSRRSSLSRAAASGRRDSIRQDTGLIESTGFIVLAPRPDCGGTPPEDLPPLLSGIRLSSECRRWGGFLGQAALRAAMVDFRRQRRPSTASSVR